MNQFLPGVQVNYLFDIRTSCKIKIIEYHPTKPWICYITNNNIFSLWDYEKKACIRAFNTNYIDQ